MAALPALARRHRNRGWFAINVAAEEILDPVIYNRLAQLGAGVILEWVEPAHQEDQATMERTARMLDHLRRHRGIRIAIDDLGSHERHIQRHHLIRPDMVKLAGTVMRRVAESDWSHARFCEEVAGWRRQGVLVVVEGIESPTDRDLVRQAGIVYGQGWFWDPQVAGGHRLAGIPSTPGGRVIPLQAAASRASRQGD